MYKCTLYDTTRFKAVMVMNLSEIPGWVTSWEVWYGEPKADSIVSLGVGRYNWPPIKAMSLISHFDSKRL
jgi:hypothetical protein